MKSKIKNAGVSGGCILLIESGKGEKLEYSDAARLKQGGLLALAPFSYEQKGKLYEFRYTVGNATSLVNALKTPLPVGSFQAMLVSLYDALCTCEKERLSRLRLLLEPEMVFWDQRFSRFQFAYYPVSGFSSKESESTFLEYLCGHVKLAPQEVPLRDAVLDYALRNSIITRVKLEEFLRQHHVQLSGHHPTFHAVSFFSTDPLDNRSSFGWNFAKEGEIEVEHVNQVGCDNRSSVQSQSGMFRLIRSCNGERYKMGNGDYYVGRDESCSLCLADAKSVSRIHAMIRIKNREATVVDLGSTNGTLLNGQVLEVGKPRQLVDGDVVSFGLEEFDIDT